MSVSDGLRLHDVGVSLGGREILCGVDLAVAPGSVVAIAGRNGAGKTTLLRVASRSLRASRGRVTLDGAPLEALSRRQLAREIAVVPQDAPMAFPFRAGEVVLMGRTPHLGVLGFEQSRDVAVAREAMERVGIADLADRSILELSGGERQLVLIARALAQDARILLLDEPTAHLDLAHRVAVSQVVRDFATGGRSALVVSHDLSLTARTCDRLVLLGAGRILAEGAPLDVVTPDHLEAAFGVRAVVVEAPDGSPVVVPRLPVVARLPDRPPGR